jgi:hypothetical protein
VTNKPSNDETVIESEDESGIEEVEMEKVSRKRKKSDKKELKIKKKKVKEDEEKIEEEIIAPSSGNLTGKNIT